MAPRKKCGTDFGKGASHFLWFGSILGFRVSPGVLCSEVAIGIGAVQHGSIRGQFQKTRERRAPRSKGARAVGCVVADHVSIVLPQPCRP